MSVPDVCIFRFGGALHFCNVSYFRRRLTELTGLGASRSRDLTASHVTTELSRRRVPAGATRDTEVGRVRLGLASLGRWSAAGSVVGGRGSG